MKKLVSLVLALVLALSMAAISTPASAEAATNLVVWVLGPGEQADHDMVMAKFNEQLSEVLPGVYADISIMSGDYKDILNRALAAGEQIDIAWIGWHHNINQMAVDGNILPLDDLLAEHGQAIIESLGQDTLDNHRVMDGLIYQIPCWQGMVGGRSASYLLGEIVDLLPETWLEETQAMAYEFKDTPTVEGQDALYAQYEMYFKAAQDNGLLRSGIDVAGFTYPGFGVGTRWSNGYAAMDYNDTTFTAYWNGATELQKNHYKHMADFYDKGYIRSDILSYTPVGDWKDGLSDQDYIFTGHNAWVDNYQEDMTQMNGFPCEIIYNYKFNNYNLGTSTGMCIPYTSVNPELSMQLLSLMFTNKDLYTTFVFGLEGEHYTVQEDGSLLLNGGSTQSTADWEYGQWCWTFGSCEMLTKTQNPTHDPEYYAELKELEKIAWSSPFLTFAFDKTNVETEISALDAINKEYTDALGKGVKGAAGWEAYYNEFVDQMKANGIDTVIAEYQNQINAFVELKGITEWNFPTNAGIN